MALSFLSPARTVLLVSDEFLSIFAVGASGVRLIETVPWATEDFDRIVAKIITKQCSKKPVLILNDMVEQHYRKERVVKAGVSVVDKASMLKRRLNVAFPNYQIRSAYPLKEKVPKTDKQPASDIYIFAALPDSDQINQTISATRKSLASVAGFCLLPVESSDMVKALVTKLGKKNRKNKTWAVFVGQHRNGSLRQVLTKNGELALTRMSPMNADDSDPQSWARDLYQEFKSTMSYLTRFGFEPEDGLDVFIAADTAPGQALREIFEEECDLHIMGVDEYAKALGVSIGPQPDRRYTDVLHAAWAGRKSRFILPMKAAQVDEVSQPRQVAMLLGLVLLAGAAFLGYQAASQIGSIATMSSDIKDTKNRKAQLDAQFQRELERLEAQGFDVRLVQSSIAVYEEFEEDRIKALDMFKGIGGALGKDLRIDSVDIKKLETDKPENAWDIIPTNQPKETFEASIKITYPSTADIDRGNQEVSDLRDRISARLPDLDVEVTKLLKDYEYTEGLVIEAGDLATENIQQDFVAEITLTGIEKPDEALDGYADTGGAQ